jgi:hypothetical protein
VIAGVVDHDLAGWVRDGMSCKIEPGSERPDFRAVFSRIGECLLLTLRELPAPDGRVYACGFWNFYCDYTTLGSPCFAYNLVGHCTFREVPTV